MIDELSDLFANSRALRVRKKPTPVRVDFAATDGACETLEGTVRYRAGDAILTGVQGERWPIRRDLFLAGYDPVPPTRVGENGSYQKAPVVVHAAQLARSYEVRVSWKDDPLNGRPGDWLLRYPDGTYGIVQDSIFRESYAPAPGESRWPPSTKGT